MQKRHAAQLESLLEKVSHAGYATVPRSLIVAWFGQERFTVNIRRELATHWEELNFHSREGEGNVLRVVAIPDTNTVLLFRDSDLKNAEDPLED
mgnify:CR=1 FL=1